MVSAPAKSDPVLRDPDPSGLAPLVKQLIPLETSGPSTASPSGSWYALSPCLFANSLTIGTRPMGSPETREVILRLVLTAQFSSAS